MKMSIGLVSGKIAENIILDFVNYNDMLKIFNECKGLSNLLIKAKDENGKEVVFVADKIEWFREEK